MEVILLKQKVTPEDSNTILSSELLKDTLNKEDINDLKNLINTLIKQRYWNGYKFYDWENFDMPKHPNYPKAYYVGTKVTFNEHRWKTDIWIVEKFPSNIDNSWIEEKAKGDKKLKILEFKKVRDASNLGVSSYDIYDAVINKNINSFKDLKEQI